MQAIQARKTFSLFHKAISEPKVFLSYSSSDFFQVILWKQSNSEKKWILFIAPFNQWNFAILENQSISIDQIGRFPNFLSKLFKLRIFVTN